MVETKKVAEINIVDLAQRIIVAIPTLNEINHIEDCIRSLSAGVSEAFFNNLEIIIADGGSTDGTRDKVTQLAGKYQNITLVDNPGRFQSAGVNIAARESSPVRDIIIRCDAHADYPQGFLLSAAKSFLRSGADNLVMPMDAIGAGCFQRANAWVVDTKLGSGGSAHRGGHKSGYVDHGHHGVIDKNKFLALGGYDESFSHNEDAEFDARLIAGGGKVWLEAEIRIGYFPRQTPQSLWKQYFGYGRGRARNILKNKQMPRLRQLIPVINIVALASSFLLMALHPVFIIWPVFYLALLSATSLWMMAKKKSLCGLWSGVALSIMHLSWGLGFLRGWFSANSQRGRG